MLWPKQLLQVYRAYPRTPFLDLARMNSKATTIAITTTTAIRLSVYAENACVPPDATGAVLLFAGWVTCSVVVAMVVLTVVVLAVVLGRTGGPAGTVVTGPAASMAEPAAEDPITKLSNAKMATM
jgi:hypothetical protein